MNWNLKMIAFLSICAVLLIAIPASAKASFSGGDGTNIDKAIVVNAVNEDEGVGAEYEWLAAKFGPRNVIWKMDRQSTSNAGGKIYDILELEFLQDVGSFKKGNTTEFFFDITGFYGKF